MRKTASPVSPRELANPELASLIVDLIDTMRDAGGAGLAAPQIFVSKQVCVLEVQANPRYPTLPSIPLRVLLNPRVTPCAESDTPSAVVDMYEGCLSVPGIRGRVRRCRRVRLQALAPGGEELNEIWEGPAASVLQHEVDHLNGRLFVDLAATDTLSFLDEFERYVPAEERIIDLAAGGPQT